MELTLQPEAVLAEERAGHGSGRRARRREVTLAGAAESRLEARPVRRVGRDRVGDHELDVRTLLRQVRLHPPHERLPLSEVDEGALLLPPAVVEGIVEAGVAV